MSTKSVRVAQTRATKLQSSVNTLLDYVEGLRAEMAASGESNFRVGMAHQELIRASQSLGYAAYDLAIAEEARREQEVAA
jgi:hypothetical protein